jgi:excisionase family DNA binding protein
MTTTLPERTVLSERDHAEQIAAVKHALDTDAPLPAHLPAEVYQALRMVLAGLVEGGVVIAALPSELSTSEAAELLGVSRPTLVKLLDEGEIEGTRTSVHRRAYLDSVLDYRERRRAKRAAGIEEMHRITEEFVQPGDAAANQFPKR